MPTPFIPTRASLHYRRSFVSPWPDVEGISAVDLHRYSDIQKLEDWPRFSTLDLQRLIAFRGLELGASLFVMAKGLSTRTDLQTSERVYGIEVLPKEFYQRSEDPRGRISSEVLSKYFTAKQLKEAARYNRATWMSSYTTSFCRDSPQQCAYFNQARQVVEAQGY